MKEVIKSSTVLSFLGFTVEIKTIYKSGRLLLENNLSQIFTQVLVSENTTGMCK